ncbi:unnamed protein product [Linum tenue]|uniref:Cytochrome P450 n=1 Tax=Linum tenue TaxID=586396 RepID=A0AAV0JJ06_9ROSI|nr:unnamed protein product [Linum tenue]
MGGKRGRRSWKHSSDEAIDVPSLFMEEHENNGLEIRLYQLVLARLWRLRLRRESLVVRRTRLLKAAEFTATSGTGMRKKQRAAAGEDGPHRRDGQIDGADCGNELGGRLMTKAADWIQPSGFDYRQGQGDSPKAHDKVLSDRHLVLAGKAHNLNDFSLTALPVDSKWRNLRKVCNSYIFTTQKMDVNQELRNDKVVELVEGVRRNASEKAVVDVGRAAFNATLNSLSANHNRETTMDSNCIKYLFLDLFVAGTDTTSSTIERAMTELLRNSDKLAKVKELLNQTIGKCIHLQESGVPRLPYLQAVVKETFRLHPAVPLLLPRKAGVDVEICGFIVPKGAKILVNVWAIGRDPMIWDNPNSFMPERFLGSKVDAKGNNFELLPFGAGRRICPGMPLALRMLHMMLGYLVHWFEWKLPNEVMPEKINMEEKFGIALQKAKPLLAVPTPI